MATNIKVNIKMENLMEKENINGQMEIYTKVNLLMEWEVAKENGYKNSKMVIVMQECIWMTRNTD